MAGKNGGVWAWVVFALVGGGVLAGVLPARAQGAEETAAGAGAPAPAVRCPKCGRAVDGRFRFCPFDGAALARTPRCSRCGRRLQSDWRFCPWDGAPIERLPAPAATPRVAPPAESRAVSSRAAGNPIDVIEQVFDALVERDRARLIAAYDWARFMPRGAQESDDAYHKRRERYLEPLFERVAPLAKGARRRMTDIKLSSESARISVALWQPPEGERPARSQRYTFTLARDGAGRWRVCKIEP